MLYKFKSRSAPDLIMLEPHGRQILQIVGKTPGVERHHHGHTDSRCHGGARSRRCGRRCCSGPAQETADEEGAERPDTVRLRQRAAPFLEMRRSVAEEHDVVWGLEAAPVSTRLQAPPGAVSLPLRTR